jgi:hypothetical protein
LALTDNLKDIQTEQDKAASDFETKKLKYLNNVDEIIGVSEMKEPDTIEFLKKNKIPNISFVLDSQNFSFNKSDRFEMLIDNNKIIEFRKDPSIAKLFFIYLFMAITIGTVGYFSQNLYIFLFNNCYFI